MRSNQQPATQTSGTGATGGKERRPQPQVEEHDPWYKWGVGFQYLELIIAIAVTLFSLYMALSGTGGFPGK